ncbi:hypothetical protein [Wukongibacter sp. M2B1]
MSCLYEIVMEIAMGIEEIYLNSSRRLSDLVGEGIELIEKGTEEYE